MLFVVGCGANVDGPERHAIYGEVTFDGQPVQRGVISLLPTDGTTGPVSGCEIVDGNYNIPSSKGPVSGRYLVQITATRKTGNKVEITDGPEAGQEIEEISQFIPAQYNDTSNLKIAVGPDAAEHNFHLEGTTARVAN